MRIHILGVCGTFMAGVAVLARHLGHEVSGSDANFYPPMSDVLENAGIVCYRGYEPAHLDPEPDIVVIGNALSRGNPAVEYVLNRGLRFTSGPAWLAEHFLRDRWVIAVSGTHGKTTTSSMVAWILEDAGLDPGFLIGGLPGNFGVSARAGSAPFFVIEADEYDSAFFDKRSKFVHYGPRTLVINNIEFDHADIFPTLDAIKTQFHHVVRTVPGNGQVIYPAHDEAVTDVLERGLWSDAVSLEARPTPGERTDAPGTPSLRARFDDDTGNCFTVMEGDKEVGQVKWSLIGAHNVQNGLSAIAAARHAGVTLDQACNALATFQGVRRRLELRGTAQGVHVYDDFAHHPTAISAVLAAMRTSHPHSRIIALLEPRSNTMRLGHQNETLGASLAAADAIWAFQPPDIDWQLAQVLPASANIRADVQSLIDDLVRQLRSGDHVVVMSNGSFENIHERLLDALGLSTPPSQVGKS